MTSFLNLSQNEIERLCNSNFLVGNSQGDGDCGRKEDEAKRRQLLRKRQVTRNQRGIIGTPPPVCGRKHETIQTEKYLEEVNLEKIINFSLSTFISYSFSQDHQS